jgi:hypothetical protein
MRSSCLARVVLAGLGVPLVLTLGCDGRPSVGPSEAQRLQERLRLASVSMSPTRGASTRATVATIRGAEFQAGTTVTVDGARIDATVVDTNTISLVMPAHASGTVAVAVIRTPGQTPVSVYGGYTYVGPPVIELSPNIGSTAGGTPMVITGPGDYDAKTVRFDGIVTPVGSQSDYGYTYFELLTPAHAAGPVEVIVTDEYDQAGSAVFTYASPDTFDVNGDWEGSAEPAPREWGTRVVLTIRDNKAVSVLCLVCRDQICPIGSAPSLALDPPPVVANGEFSFVGSGGVSIAGTFLSPVQASGSLDMPSCGSRRWSASKKK